MARADDTSTTVPLFSLFSDWRLRQIFNRACRDQGDTFAVPAPRRPVLTGGAAQQLELEVVS
jgi:hypothetical protein